MDDKPHIDGTKMQGWIPELLDLKGVKAKPTHLEANRVSCIIDMGQGGFGAERAQTIYVPAGFGLSGSPSGETTLASTKFSSATTEGRTLHARMHSAYLEVILDTAGALAMDDRQMWMGAYLQPEAGSDCWLCKEDFEIKAEQSRYFLNIMDHWDGFIPPGFQLLVAAYLQPDFIGVGSADFPANSNGAAAGTITVKETGGQLPI